MYQNPASWETWDPRRADYEDQSFNSYVHGPARHLVGTKKYGNTRMKNTTLYVGGIPLELTETGLGNLFSRSGKVINAKIMRNKTNPNARDTYGFVRMASVGDAERAIRDMNGFEIEGFRFRVKMSFSDEERAKRKEEQMEMQSMFFNEDEESDSDDRLLFQQTQSKENQPQPAMNGYGGHTDNFQSKGRGRGHVLSEITGSYGMSWGSTQVSPRDRGPGSYPRAGPGPGGDNFGNVFKRNDTGLLPTPPARDRIQNNPMENLTITVDRDNHRNLSTMNETLTLDSVNRGVPGPSIHSINQGFGAGRENHYNMGQNPDMGYRGHGRGNPMYGGHGGMDKYSMYTANQGGHSGYGRGGKLPGSYPTQPPVHAFNQYPPMMSSPAHNGLLQPAQRPGVNLHSTTMDETLRPQNYDKQVKEKPKRKVETAVADCTYCGKPGNNRCGACKSPYCSQDCQTADWPQHKHVCKTINKERDMAEAFESQFDVTAGDELIPEVQKLMERATGDKIEVKKKDKKDHAKIKNDAKNRQRNPSGGSDKQGQKSGRQVKEDFNKTVIGNERESKETDRRGRGQKTDGYETDIGMDRRSKNRRVDTAGYETDAGRDKKACYNCGSTSHVRSDCPKPHGVNSKCYNCQKVGHLSKECPLKQGQNTQKPSSHQQRSNKPNSLDNKPIAASTNDDWDNDKEPAKPSSRSGTTGAPLAHSTPRDHHQKEEKPSPDTPVSSRKHAVIPVTELPMNKEVPVVVTDAVSFDEIWIQDVEQTIPLQDTMVAMLQKFSESACDVKLNEVKVGNYYGAQFTDGAWYRVCVKNLTRPGDIEVHYIDFGNSETTKIDKLRQLESVMMKESAKAILCSLDMDPKLSSKVDSAMLKKHVIPDKLYKAMCKKIVKKADKKTFQIDLKNENDADVMAVIEEEVNTALKTQETAKPPSPNSQSLVLLIDIPSAACRLEPGQKYGAIFAYVPSPNQFTVQIVDPDNQTEFSMFDEKLQGYYNDKDKEPYRPTTEGEVIVSKYSDDNKWYRAEVTQINKSDVDVVFIDYGNAEKAPFEACRKIKSDFTRMERKCVTCSLYKIDIPAECPPEIVTLFQFFSSNIVMIEVKDVKQDVHAIELFTPDGQSYSDEIRTMLGQNDNSNEGEKRKTPVKEEKIKVEDKPKSEPEKMGCVVYGELELNKKTEVVPSDITTLSLFNVRISSDENAQQLATLMLELNQACVSAKPHKPMLEEFVAAQFFDGEQTLWYRGQVMEITNEGFRVLYVDYGNMDLVKADGITELDPKFCSLPTVAIPCALKGMEAVANNELLLSNFKIVLNRLVIVKATSCVNGIYEVEMFLQDGTSVNDTLMAVMKEMNEGQGGVSDTESASKTSQSGDAAVVNHVSGDAKDSRPAVNESAKSGALSDDGKVAKTSLPSDTETPAITVHINNLASFFVQTTDPSSATALIELMKELNEYCSKNTNPYTCRESEYVAALFDEGGSKSWYRAQVLSADSAGAMMIFIDYGNTDKVKFDDVRKLEPKFLKLPMKAIHCCLAGSDGTDSPDIIEEFNNILNHQVYLKVQNIDNGIHYVEMLLTNPEKTNVNTLLRLDPTKNMTLSATQDRPSVPPALTSMRGSDEAAQSVRAKAEPLTASTSMTTSGDKVKSFPKPPKSTLDIGKKISGAAMFIDSVESFYFMYGDIGIQRLLGELMTGLNTECKEQSAGYTPGLGEYIAAFYSENGSDEMWYRGVVKEDCGNGMFKVHYIDYGNNEVIETKHIKKLEDSYLELPAFSTHCKIAGCEQLGEESQRKFKSLEGVSLSVIAEGESDGIYEVQVFNQDDKNILEVIGGGQTKRPVSGTTSTELVDQLPRPQTPVGKERLPKKSASPQSAERTVVFSQTVTKIRPQEKEFQVVITSPVRPNLFHCQCIDNTNLLALKLLSDQMKIDCEETVYDGTKNKFEVGEMCCAKFVDGDWYRATILDVFPDNTVSVEYVDYGNRSEVSVENLRPVRPEYTELPLLAFKCTLSGVMPLETSWSEKAIAEFSKFAEKLLVAKTISLTNDVYELDITDAEGVNIAQHLIDIGVAKKEQDEELDDKERMRRENELLRKQLEEMQSQMAKMKMNK